MIAAWARVILTSGFGAVTSYISRAGTGRRPRRRIARRSPAGVARAWLNLAYLLGGQPGREREEEAALRAAMASADLETAAWASAHLGDLLESVVSGKSV